MKNGLQDVSPVGDNSSKWYNEYPKGEAPYKHTISEVEIIDLKAEAKRHLDAETAVFQSKQAKSRDSETIWLRTALTQGTTSDKIAAGIVMVQDNPKYNLGRLISLVNQVRVAKHNQCNMTITSLRDLFLSDLLHPKYKLFKFEDQNFDELNETSSDGIVKTDALKKKLLAHWYFEDQLQEQYERFITSLAGIASDTVDANREAAISVMTDLLIGNSEQEHKLLELIVNKIGDPSSKVASKAIFCLNKLLHKHQSMKLVVLREVEKLIFRKNVAQRAQYYAICLLSQFLLHKDDYEIAATLIEVYFAFFKACLKRGEPDSRMMAAILTGVNRAYPFANVESDILNDHIDSVYKVIHIGSFNVSLNALTLLHQVIGKDEARSTRFYSAFYRKLLDPQIGIANKRALFLNLLFRVLQNDKKIQRLYAFVKRILQITLYFPANMACATLYTVSKILHRHKELKNLLLKPQTCIKLENDDSQTDENLSCSDVAESADESDTELKDSIMLTNVTIEPDKNVDIKSKLKEEDSIKIDPGEEKEYDPFCRNPLYAGISKGLNTELLILSKHHHPSVALFANTILEGKLIDYTGDPLEDLSLMRFLDRYVFKNPKKLEDKKVKRKNDPLAQRTGYTPKGIRSIPVDSPAYINEREERIPIDEMYLYQYLKTRKDHKRKPTVDDDVESVNSEEFNDMLDRLGGGNDFEDLDIAADIQTQKTKKKKKGDGEDDESDEDLEEDIVSEGSDNSDDSEVELEGDIANDEMQDLSDIDFEDIDGEDMSDIDFDEMSDGDDDNAQSDLKYNSKRKKELKNSKKKDFTEIDDNIFVSAEKFAEMLEEQSKQKTKHGGSDVFSNIDGASSKQIDWEVQRHHKLRNSFNRNKRKGPKPFTKNVKKSKH